jgi:hypothetical protein
MLENNFLKQITWLKKKKKTTKQKPSLFSLPPQPIRTCMMARFAQNRVPPPFPGTHGNLGKVHSYPSISGVKPRSGAVGLWSHRE